MFDTIIMVIAIMIVIGGIVWAIKYEYFSGKDAKVSKTETEETKTE